MCFRALLCTSTILEDLGSESALDSALVPLAMELDSALVPLVTELASDFHSVSGSALESDSLAEPDSELAPEFDSASDSQSESLGQLRQYPLLRAYVEFVYLAQRVPV